MEDLILKAQQAAVEEMQKSVSENDGRPHPYVGAVLLFPDGSMIMAHRGEFDNGDHAEFTLLAKKCQTIEVEEATLFTTLEPCFSRHFPKIGCAQRIIDRRIRKVYIGIDDPDPSVSGRGKRLLEQAGVEIHYFEQSLQKEIYASNRPFLDDAIRRRHETKPKEKEELLEPLDEEIEGFNPKDISRKAINLFLKESGLSKGFDEQSIFDQFIKWGLIAKKKGSKDAYRYSKSFVALFASKPSHYLNNASFKLKFFGEHTNLDAPLTLMPTKIEHYLRTKIPAISIREKPQLNNQSIYPIEPLLEGCLNAIVHRDYSIQGTNNQLSIDAERVLIKSPGLPAPPQTVSDLAVLNASSIQRNHKINFIFSIMHYVENSNFGMEKFKSIYLKYKKPYPVYSYHPPYLHLSFFYDMNRLAENIWPTYPSSVAKKEVAAIEYLKIAGPSSSRDLAIALSLPSQKAVARFMNQLEEKGFVVKMGRTKDVLYKYKKQIAYDN